MIRKDLENALCEMKQSLPEKILQQFELFASELRKWNRKVNLTAIHSDSDIAVKHMIDSIVFASKVQPFETVLDIGSGAGFPAIPLKIIQSDVKVVSVDAVGKKIMFQRHASRILSLSNFEAVHARVESLHAVYANHFDVICSRAFSRLDDFVRLAAPLIKMDGRIIAMKGPDVHSEIDGVQGVLLSLGFKIQSLYDYSLPMGKGNRCLVTMIPVKSDK